MLCTGASLEHALLDVHVLHELRLELLEGGFLAREVVVRLLKVLEVQEKLVRIVRVQVRLHLFFSPSTEPVRSKTSLTISMSLAISS